MHPFHRLTHVKSFITIPAIFQCITQNSPAFLRILNRRYAAALGQSTVLSCPIRIIPEKPCFFLLGAGDITATFIIKTAQSFFMNTAYPFHLGVSREHPFPGRFSDSYTQAKNAFFCFYGDISSASTAIAALPSMEKLRFIRKQNNCTSWKTRFFPPCSSETERRLRALPQTGWRRFFLKGKFPFI